MLFKHLIGCKWHLLLCHWDVDPHHRTFDWDHHRVACMASGSHQIVLIPVSVSCFVVSFLLGKGLDWISQWDNVGPSQEATAARALGGTGWMDSRMFWGSSNNGPALCMFASVDEAVCLLKPSGCAAAFSSYLLTCPNCPVKWNTGDHRGLVPLLFMLLQRRDEEASCCCDRKEPQGSALQRLDAPRFC